MLVITTDNVMSIRDYSGDYREIGDVVGGYIEIVRPPRLSEPFRMIVNEEGMMLLNLDVNITGSVLYCTDFHGCPIYGNIVIVKEDWVHGERDIVGIDEETATLLGEHLIKMLKPLGDTLRWEKETERNKQS